MNPAIPMSYAEGGRWLENFAASHAKREHAAIVARLDRGEAREGRSYGLRLVLGEQLQPPRESAPLEFELADVLAGRSRFAWCQALAERIRAEARIVVAVNRSARSA